mmetsp:Transcript_48497/g.96620  ORF Transcript_48497/g.96620 Transcript_48497/m.96620 type:complete len:260 (-) Transcript_48497:868-1647(-)
MDTQVSGLTGNSNSDSYSSRPPSPRNRQHRTSLPSPTITASGRSDGGRPQSSRSRCPCASSVAVNTSSLSELREGAVVKGGDCERSPLCRRPLRCRGDVTDGATPLDDDNGSGGGGSEREIDPREPLLLSWRLSSARHVRPRRSPMLFDKAARRSRTRTRLREMTALAASRRSASSATAFSDFSLAFADNFLVRSSGRSSGRGHCDGRCSASASPSAALCSPLSDALSDDTLAARRSRSLTRFRSITACACSRRSATVF